MSWLSDASANRLIQSYAKNFVDVSGNFKVRSGTKTTTVDTGPVGWTQLGSDIDGEAADDLSGYSVSISSDGTIMAVGALNNDGNGSNSGHVRVYKWNGSSWGQLGSDIDGEAAGDQSGSSVSLSSDGTIVAIAGRYNEGNGYRAGHLRVYEWNGSSWTQLGSDIDGEAEEDWFGDPVSISNDGSIVAIGALYNDGNGDKSGHVRVYQYANSTWTQLGSDIDGEAAGDNSGTGVSLNSDGTIVAIGARYNSGNGYRSGHVRVFEWNGSSWSQLGSDIDGTYGNEYIGLLAVSLSSDGTIVAIGARYNDNNGTDSGCARVYQYANSTWSQLGSDIDGEAAGDFFGTNVSLSSDGTIMAVGGRFNDDNGSNSGHVRIFEWNGSSWTQIGSDIDGEAANDGFGNGISLSSDGTIVAIGAYGNDGNGSNAGHVRVYQKTGGLVTTTTSVEALDVSGGTINMLQNTMKVSPEVVDISGTSWINRGQSGNTISEAYQKGLIIESSSTSSGDAVIYVETSGQAEAFSVRANGAMYSANTLRHSSDDRRKINEQYITNATQTLKKLSPQIYTKLNDLLQNGGTPTKTESGLIAQEIYYNAPELRHLVYSDGQPLAYDLSGATLQNDPDYSALGWGSKSATVDYIGLIPYLIKSNQEQQESIDNKQQQIVDNKKALEEDIQSRIAALET